MTKKSNSLVLSAFNRMSSFASKNDLRIAFLCRHKKEIADKYCERGAEWGVGDCSLVGMTQEEKEAFMKVLKKK